jgi:hypothetical protein
MPAGDFYAVGGFALEGAFSFDGPALVPAPSRAAGDFYQ